MHSIGFGIGVAELTILLLIALLLGALITGIVLWATSGRGGSGEMACGSCGYAVRGLSELNCPECGVDLREAGIRKTGSPGKKLAGIVLTFGSVGVFLLMCLLSSFLFVSQSSTSSTPTVISSPAPATSGSSTDESDEFEADETGASEDEQEDTTGTPDTP